MKAKTVSLLCFKKKFEGMAGSISLHFFDTPSTLPLYQRNLFISGKVQVGSCIILC